MEQVIDWVGSAWEHREEALAWFAALVLALSVLVRLLQSGAHALERFAALTSSKRDDAVAHRLAAWADAAAGALDWIAGALRPLSLHGRGKGQR